MESPIHRTTVEDASAKVAPDRETSRATRLFVQRLGGRLSPSKALVFGSRSRGEHCSDSDADLAVILSGDPGNRWSVVREMARLAFDVMLETDVLIDPLPLWEVELEHPERFGNPAPIHAILRDGLPI